MSSAAVRPDDTRPAPAARPRWISRAALAGVLALLVGVAVVVWASPVLGLRTIDVTGPGAHALAGDVTEAVGVARGTPLARIDTGEVRARVLTVGAVASATVTRRWPHTLVVTVTERTPVAVTEANGRWWLLDDTGTPYQEVDTPPAGLVPIDLATPGPHDRATIAAVQVLGQLDEAIRTRVSAVVAPTAYTISLTLTDGRRVVWGDATDAAQKNAVLPAMLRQPGAVIDISDPTLVTVRDR